MDDAIRHAITKLSHLHFAAAPEYARRIEQMGENPDHVFISGSPVVDTILADQPLSEEELEASLGVPVRGALLITYHPVTLEHERTEERIAMLLEVLARFENRLIFTYPNADTNNAVIVNQLRAFVGRHPLAHLFVNLGRKKYHSLQRYVGAMVGNSSSGIIEAASFRLPVVNLGDRQAGRMSHAQYYRRAGEFCRYTRGNPQGAVAAIPGQFSADAESLWARGCQPENPADPENCDPGQYLA